MPTPASPAPGLSVSRIDEAFEAAAGAQPEMAVTPGTPPALARAPMPAARPADVPGAPADAAAAAATSAASKAEAPAAAPHIPPPFAEAPARRVEGRAFADQRYPIGREAHLPTIKKYAEASRVPIDLADAIATIESAYDPHAVGSADEIGIMQVRSSVARDVGFEGPAQTLFDPETNIRIGVSYLAGAWERSGGNVCQALMKYRIGWDETRISPLSAEYCRRALLYLNAIGSPLARGLSPPPALNGVPGAGVGRGLFNWSDHDTRLRQIEQRFGGENFGIIAR
ncbi:lytic transglycosylase domain-containing protein [Phreatobacter stygius]|nr:lytic transglycosylase domain-containing protein [Phreatobacter stygius]